MRMTVIRQSLIRQLLFWNKSFHFTIINSVSKIFSKLLPAVPTQSIDQ